MARFVAVTAHTTGTEFRVNVDAVAYLSHTDEGRASLFFGDDKYVVLRETYVEAVALICGKEEQGGKS